MMTASHHSVDGVQAGFFVEKCSNSLTWFAFNHFKTFPIEIQRVVTYVGQELFIYWLRFCLHRRWPVTPVNVFRNVSFMRSLKAFFTTRSSWCAPHLSTNIAMTFIWQ